MINLDGMNNVYDGKYDNDGKVLQMYFYHHIHYSYHLNWSFFNKSTVWMVATDA